jgi:uroporphyrinogen-III decarboxylase
MVLMGGISPCKWLPATSEKDFIAHVKEWLDLRKVSSRLVQSAGDQVPPGTELKRIKLMYDLVEEYGRY